MESIQNILRLASEKRASDIHFSAEEPIRFRIDGDLIAVTESPVSSVELEALLFEILSEEEKMKLYQNKNLDKSCLIPHAGQFRVNMFFNRKGIAAVLRAIPSKTPSLETLGLPEVIKKMAEKPRGLILVTGPTGSGKSTTLAAIIDYINSNFPYHILTVEDPVEFIHASKRSLVNQRDIGHSCHSFQDALKFALREDPDVILIGELRDLDTISLALTAAETGHLVFGTLHTRGAAPSVDRIIDSFPANQQSMIRAMLADSLIAVISQALLKRADEKGRVAAYEIMVVNSAISNLIREGKVFQIEGVIQTGKKDGMMLMDQSLMNLVSTGQVTMEEATSYFKTVPTSVPKAVNAKSPMTAPASTPHTLKVSSVPPPKKTPPSDDFFLSDDSVEDSLFPQTSAKPSTPPPAPPPLKKKVG